jgi:hypothetical protein
MVLISVCVNGEMASPLGQAAARNIDDWSPRGHARRYIDACYTGMRDDTARTRAYEQAIQAAVQGKTVVDLGTGALALLAIIAAKAGASHVYPIEVAASRPGHHVATLHPSSSHHVLGALRGAAR